jgi:hypothetical protein
MTFTQGDKILRPAIIVGLIQRIHNSYNNLSIKMHKRSNINIYTIYIYSMIKYNNSCLFLYYSYMRRRLKIEIEKLFIAIVTLLLSFLYTLLLLFTMIYYLI